MKKPKYPAGIDYSPNPKLVQDVPALTERFWNTFDMILIWTDDPAFTKYNLRGYAGHVKRAKSKVIPEKFMSKNTYKYLFATPQIRFLDNFFTQKDEIYNSQYVGSVVVGGYEIPLYYILAKNL
jgi:hypothetical protein